MRASAVVLAVLLAGCPAPEEPPPATSATLTIDGSSLTWDDTSALLSMDAGGLPLLRGATASVMLDATDDTGRRLSFEDDRERAFATDAVSGPLGDGDRLRVTRFGASGEPDLEWTIVGYPGSGAWTFALRIDNPTDAPIALAKATALEVPRDVGRGLYLGFDPAEHRIVENGSYTVLDFVAEIRTGDVAADPGWSELVPGDFAGHSVSNWSHAVGDLGGGPAWVAGALTMEASSPVLNLSYEPSWAAADDDGRAPFTYFAAEAAYVPHPRPIEPGASFASELYRVAPAEPDVQAGLERLADAIAAHNGLVPWHRREPGRRVPNGWNSWSGSSSTGGYGTGIDEALMLANLDFMATELRDWGMDWFQIDDGYEPFYGDWWWREDRFPNGPAWMAQQIRDRGLIPGLWMAPFTLDEDSETAQAHPDWLADTTAIGQVVAGGYEILDLTNPEVQEYLTELFTTFTEEWGFEWLKMDFAYYALFGDGFHQAEATREEAWRQGMAAVREGIGEDTFFLGVGAVGLNYDLLDSSRLTLDSFPVWDHDPEYGPDDHLNQQGLKPTVRSAGRRWFLQDRVWVNHPDLMFFRSNPNDPEWPEVTHEEARAFASFIGLSGGIVKLGDRLVDLEPESVNVIRALLPVYPEAARPIDLLRREYPEVWHLRVTAPEDGLDEQWHVVGLFDWGSNADMTTNPFTELADDDAPTAFAVDLSELGLDGEWLAYEFWTGEVLGDVSGTLQVEVPSHDCRVVALRRPAAHPQFLGWNRQLSMGGTLVREATWDEDASTLTFAAEVAAPTDFAPFTYELAFAVPDGFALADATSDGVAVTGWQVEEQDGAVVVRFVPEATGDLVVELAF